MLKKAITLYRKLIKEHCLILAISCHTGAGQYAPSELLSAYMYPLF